MTILQNVHVGVLRSVGSRATEGENEIDRRNFLRLATGLIVLPYVRRFFPSVDLCAPRTLTLADFAKRFPPHGNIATIIEMLSQQNEILNDMMWMEGAVPPFTYVTRRTGLPATNWRRL